MKSALKFLFISVSMTALGTASVFAQDTTDESNTDALALDPIVVTGLKQDRDLQDIPVTTNVVLGETLEVKPSVVLKDVAEFVPGFTMEAGTPVDPAFVNMRGFINGFTTVFASTAFYIDDVPFTDFSTLGQPLFEIEQIEVLKGPQSTLYGVSSQAGVVVVSSRAPSDSFEGSLAGTYGNFGAYELKGRISGPLVEDVLLGDIAFSLNGDDGYFENTVTGNDYGSQETQSARVRLQWTPTDRFTATGSLLYSESDTDGQAERFPVDIEAYNTFVSSNQFEIAPGFPVIPQGDFAVGDFDIAQETDGEGSLENIFGSLKLEYQFDTFDIVSVTAQRNRESMTESDFEGTPIAFFNAIPENDITEFSQEIRIASNEGLDSKYLWLVGASYQSFEDKANSGFRFADNSIFLLFPFGISPGVAPRFINSEFDVETYGVFGQGTVRFYDERLGLTGGLRYSNVETNHSQDPAPPSPFSNVPNGSSASEEDNTVLWRLAADWRQTDDVTFFASVATGWKPAGVNPGVENPEGSPETYVFDTETSTTYEVGVKSELFNNRVRLNATLFRNEIEDFQDQVFEGTDAFLTNAEKAITQGVEVETQAIVSDKVTIGASIGYTNAEYDKFTVNRATGFDFDGLRINGVPEFDYTAFIAADLTDDLSGVLSVNGASGNIWNEYISVADPGTGAIVFEDLLVAESDGYNTIDASLRWQFTDQLSLTGFVENLTDERYISRVDVFGSQFLAAFGFDGLPAQGFIGRPRTYGVTLQAEF